MSTGNAQTVTSDFVKNLRGGPGEPPSVMDEILKATHEERPVENIAQLISQFHGPFGGSSNSMSNAIGAIAGANSNLRRLSSESRTSTQLVNSAIAGVTNVVDTINKITCAQMNTPMLRYFITNCQQIHPAVNAYIEQHIGKYPYFQQVSEQVGTMFTIISNQNEIDPMAAISFCGPLPTLNLNDASRMLRVLFSKLFEPIAGCVEDSNKFLNTLYLRALKCEGNTAKLHPNYSKKAPLAHGHNYTMDVLHQKRAENAIPGVFSSLVNIFGDRLRLLNQIFPVDYKIKNESQLYQITLEDGNTATVDSNGRTPTKSTVDMKSLEDIKDEKGFKDLS